MVKSKVCHSDELETKDAIEDILQQAGEFDQPVKAMLVFSDIEKNLSQIAEALLSKHPDAEIIGSSSYGEFSSEIGWQEDSLAVLFFYGTGFSVKPIRISGIGEDYEEVVKSTLSKYGKIDDAALCFLFAESLSIGGERIINGIKRFIPNTPIIGGLSADRWKFEKSHQIHGTDILTHSAVGLLFFGDIEVNVCSKEGWKPEDTVDRINKAEGNVVYKIGDVSAFDYYKSWLGRDDAPLGEYPLFIRQEDDQGYYLRAPLLFGHTEDGSIQFAGNVPEGAEVSITRAKPDEVLEAARSAGEEMNHKTNGKAEIAVFISCAARRNLLGTRAQMEFSKAREALGHTIPTIGMHAYGEFLYDPKNEKQESFRNESFCILTIQGQDEQQEKQR